MWAWVCGVIHVHAYHAWALGVGMYASCGDVVMEYCFWHVCECRGAWMGIVGKGDSGMDGCRGQR